MIKMNKSQYYYHYSDFEAYSCKFSPYEKNKIACCFSQYYGIIGNGRIGIFAINDTDGSLTEISRMNTNDGCFDIAWSESNENLIACSCGDGTVITINK